METQQGAGTHDWDALISDAQVEAVRQVGHIARGQYDRINVRHALDFFTRRYVTQLWDFARSDEVRTVADVGAGYGWLAMAFVLSGFAGRVIAVEPEAERLEAGREIAAILGIADRIDWRPGRLGSLPLGDREADVVNCIEVLEHVYRERATVRDLARVCNKYLIVTTPNLWFPVIAHDTRLPFCHWLPLPMRRAYASLCRRTDCENDNLFWSPRTLERELPGFHRVSRFLHYASLDKYLATYPCHLPYGRGGDQYLGGIGRAKRAWYHFAAMASRRSHYLMPSLAGVYKRT